MLTAEALLTSRLATVLIKAEASDWLNGGEEESPQSFSVSRV